MWPYLVVFVVDYGHNSRFQVVFQRLTWGQIGLYLWLLYQVTQTSLRTNKSSFRVSSHITCLGTVWGQIAPCSLLVILHGDIVAISTTWDGVIYPSHQGLLVANNTFFLDVLAKNIGTVGTETTLRKSYMLRNVRNKLLIPCLFSKCGGTVKWGTILIFFSS